MLPNPAATSGGTVFSAPKRLHFPPAVAANALPAQWEAPDYWAVPFDYAQQDCVIFYATRTSVLQYEVPAGSLVTVTGVSYQFTTNLVVGDIFEVSLLRNHELLASWEDRVVSTTGDRGARFALCSHLYPMRVRAYYIANSRITVAITYRGQEPFTKTPGDELQTKADVLLRGFQTRDVPAAFRRNDIDQTKVLQTAADYERAFRGEAR